MSVQIRQDLACDLIWTFNMIWMCSVIMQFKKLNQIYQSYSKIKPIFACTENCWFFSSQFKYLIQFNGQMTFNSNIWPEAVMLFIAFYCNYIIPVGVMIITELYSKVQIEFRYFRTQTCDVNVFIVFGLC